MHQTTWCLAKKEEGLFSAVERKGPVKDAEVWRIRYNRKLYGMFKEPDIITVLMKIARLRWAEHVIRMSDSVTP
jgi:hypothetical protein